MEAGCGDGEGGANSPEPQRYCPALAAVRLEAASRALTAPAMAHHRVQRSDEVGHDGVGVVQPREHRDDVGAGIGVLLGEGGI